MSKMLKKICISPGSGDRTGYGLIALSQAFAVWNLFPKREQSVSDGNQGDNK